MSAIRSYTALAGALARTRPGLSQLLNLCRYYRATRRRNEQACLSYRPVMFGAHITYRCNLACRFCYNAEVNSRGPEGDLSVEEFRGFLEHRLLRDAIRVTFTGGEPLLNSGLFEMIAMARRHRKLTYVTTNALLAEERLSEFESTPLTTLQVSLYRGHLEAQERAVERIRAVNPRLSLVLSRIVSADPSSWQGMEDTAVLARRLDVRNLQFVAEQPTPENPCACFLDDNAAMIDHLRVFRAKYGREFVLDLPRPLPRHPPDGRFCIAPFAGPYVGKGGSLSPCCEILPPQDDMGNLVAEGAWNNAFFQRMRSEFDNGFPVHPRCENCSNWVQGRERAWFV